MVTNRQQDFHGDLNGSAGKMLDEVEQTSTSRVHKVWFTMADPSCADHSDCQRLHPQVDRLWIIEGMYDGSFEIIFYLLLMAVHG